MEPWLNAYMLVQSRPDKAVGVDGHREYALNPRVELTQLDLCGEVKIGRYQACPSAPLASRYCRFFLNSGVAPFSCLFERGRWMPLMRSAKSTNISLMDRLTLMSTPPNITSPSTITTGAWLFLFDGALLLVPPNIDMILDTVLMSSLT
jgi:hypothetical protein